MGRPPNKDTKDVVDLHNIDTEQTGTSPIFCFRLHLTFRRHCRCVLVVIVVVVLLAIHVVYENHRRRFVTLCSGAGRLFSFCCVRYRRLALSPDNLCLALANRIRSIHLSRFASPSIPSLFSSSSVILSFYNSNCCTYIYIHQTLLFFFCRREGNK